MIEAFLILWFSHAILAAVSGSRSSDGAFRYGFCFTCEEEKVLNAVFVVKEYLAFNDDI